MNTMTRNALSAYNKVGIETGVDAADPQKLILMLFAGAQLATKAAKQHMLLKETVQKGAAISKAIMIIDSGLKASLDSKTGGEIAQRLHALYDYMVGQLLVANRKNEPDVLDEVTHLLTELQDAWAAIGTKNTPPTTAAATQPPSADRSIISYGKV